ncbi:MAG: dihydroorotate dehydrogenase [Paludibacteraceae bacterium]|nr:dihydroorotate dehydrogenase [Paludibacteraceae bacterium]
MNSRLNISLGRLRLQNPIIPASGTYGFGLEFAKLYDINCLGALCIKGTTVQPRYGNPSPRIAETEAGMLNSVGLQNPGVDKVTADILPRLRAVYHQPIVANISGFSIEEYVQLAKQMSDAEQVELIEVNISCPNVHNGGMAFGTDPSAAAEVTAAVKAVSDKPVFVKLSPNVTDITRIAIACEQAGADGLCLINTLLGMRIDLRTRKPVLANKYGGISGSCIFPLALRMVNQVSRVCQIPVIGCGGISTASDVIEMMMAGASAVEIGAANLTDPYVCMNIINELPQLMDKLGIDNLSDIIGITAR